MDSLFGILMFVLWIGFSIYNASKKAAAKKAADEKKKQQRTVTTQESRPQPKKPEPPKPTFQELMEEIRRAAEVEAQKKAAAKREKELARELKARRIEDQEKKRHEEYMRFVEKQRHEQHDAESHQLDQRIMKVYSQSRKKPALLKKLDLKHIIISDAILNRPYK